MEVAEAKGQGKKKKMTIPVNPARLRGLKIYQRGKHYQSIKHLVCGKKEPDGYGYSYEHGWSLHYFLYCKDAARYRAFLKLVRKKRGPDLSAYVAKSFGKKQWMGANRSLDLDKLDEEWRAFTAKLKSSKR